ncbi:MAG: Nramp family divalent metal transporter [Planctomycetota bacterium]
MIHGGMVAEASDPIRPDKPRWRGVLQIGPAIIVAAVVLGPGSIVNASRVGCRYGYELLWVVVIAGFLMLSATLASMQIGVYSKETPCDFLRRTIGRAAAWIVGGSLLFAIVLFQASNNHAMALAFEGMNGTATKSADSAVPFIIVLSTNAVVVLLLVAGRRNLYRIIERGMMVLVGLMLVAFLATLALIDTDWARVLSGLMPNIPESQSESTRLDWLNVAALIATTFSVAAAFFQSYQVRQRQWSASDLGPARQDSLVGIATLAFMTMTIVLTAAGALHNRIDAGELTSAVSVAAQLRPLFGDSAATLFSLGILAGALSSFVVNAVIGGAVASDAIGAGSDLQSRSVRMLTIASLTIGMTISLGVMMSDIELVSFMIVAQALTVLSFPLLAITLVAQWRGICAFISPLERWLVGIGLLSGVLVVLGLAFRTTYGLLTN